MYSDEELPLTAQDLFKVLDDIPETERRELSVRVTCGLHGLRRPLLMAQALFLTPRRELRLVAKSGRKEEAT